MRSSLWTKDDTFAIIARMVVNQYDGLSPTSKEGRRLLELAKIKGPQLPSTNQYSITTIRMLYKLASILAVSSGDPNTAKGLKQSSPTADIVESMYDEHIAFWEGLRSNVEAMRQALGSEPSDRVAGRYRHRLGGHILFRPVGQEAFGRALRVLLDRSFTLEEGIRALSETRMTLEQPPWRQVMWEPNQSSMNRVDIGLAASLLLFMVGQPPADPDFDLEAAYREAAGDQSVPLSEIRAIHRS